VWRWPSSPHVFWSAQASATSCRSPNRGNLAPGNAGPILVSDFLTPILILALLLWSTREPEAKSPETLALEAELEIAKRAMRNYKAALNDLGGTGSLRSGLRSLYEM
jgi:hypothetical protein